MSRRDVEYWVFFVLAILISFFGSVYFNSSSGSIFDFSHGAFGKALLDAGRAFVAIMIGRLIWTKNVKKAVYKQIGNKDNKEAKK